MSEKSKKIAEEIARLKNQKTELDKNERELKRDLYIQTVYDKYVDETQKVGNGQNINTKEGEYPIVETDVGKTTDGVPYMRIAKHDGDPIYSDCFSGTYIFPVGKTVSIATVNEGVSFQYFCVDSYDPQTEESTLLVSGRFETAPKEFSSVYEQVEKAISNNTQQESPVE